MPIEFNFAPEVRLRDGRIVRNLTDAAQLVREHEPRPGVDQRDEVLHLLERADTKEQALAAAHTFVEWLKELELVA